MQTIALQSSFLFLLPTAVNERGGFTGRRRGAMMRRSRTGAQDDFTYRANDAVGHLRRGLGLEYRIRNKEVLKLRIPRSHRVIGCEPGKTWIMTHGEQMGANRTGTFWTWMIEAAKRRKVANVAAANFLKKLCAPSRAGPCRPTLRAVLEKLSRWASVHAGLSGMGAVDRIVAERQ